MIYLFQISNMISNISISTASSINLWMQVAQFDRRFLQRATLAGLQRKGLV